MKLLPRLLTLLIASLCFSPLAFAENKAPRWNILFLFADDWGRYASCYSKVDGRPTINDVI
jgi:hypothetical protein